MKIITHYYDADLSWVNHYAEQIEGKIEGNFIKLPDDSETDIRYFLDCGGGIAAYYLNVEYRKSFKLLQHNLKQDFVGLYYNLTEGEATVTNDRYIHNVGRWQYNLTVIDGTLDSEYNVKKGSKTFALCIFIKKSMLKTFTQKNNIVIDNIDAVIDPNENTMIRFDRISNESYHILNDLKKLDPRSPTFDFHLKGTIHLLISNYLKKLASKKIIIQTVNKSDLDHIIAIQMYLVEHVKDHFPSITQMAKMSNMSESKFKTLFKKITGDTANVFFMENKLLLAKELLENKQLTISQISDQLHFTNNSYFASKFKEHFGLSPKTFYKQL